MLKFKDGKLFLENSVLNNGIFKIYMENAEPETAVFSGTEQKADAKLSNGFRLTAETDGDILKLTCKNGKKAGFLQKIEILFEDTMDAADYREYTHSRLFLEQTSGVKDVGLSTPLYMHNPPSYMIYALSSLKEEDNFIFAALPPHQGDFVVFQARHSATDMRGKFAVHITVEEDRQMDPGMAFEVSPVLIRRSEKPAADLLEDVGDMYAEQRTLKLKPRAEGWNSWDQFRAGVTPEDIYETQKNLAKFAGKRIRYYVIDDGWQIAYGAWVPNMKFPQDLSEFCRKIKDGGGIPGIWTAPVCVDNGYMYPKEWLRTTTDERIALDVTYPGVLEHIYNTYKRLADAGFRYFKIDFTNRLLSVPKLYDMRMGRAGALRSLYETIRRAIGEESYLLGCCVPYEPAFNVVDAVRTTADIQIFWSVVQINMASAAARFWAHRKLWNNDSDFMVVRGPETAEGTFRAFKPFTPGDYASGPVFSELEARTLALCLYLTGGDLMYSDNFLKLNSRGRKILKDVLALGDPKESARPLDMFTAPHGELASFWHLRKNSRLGVINWHDTAQTFLLRPEDFGKYKSFRRFWDGGKISEMEDGSFVLTLAPHESAGLELVSQFQKSCRML